MPVPFDRTLSDADARAIAVYLKSLPPTVHEVPSSTSAIPTPAGYGPPVAGVPEVDRRQTVAYGTHLSNLGHCLLRHTPDGPDGRRDVAHRLGAGGFPVATIHGSRLSANVTPDIKTGIGAWSDAEIAAALSHGTAADGTVLSPIMPWPYLHGRRPATSGPWSPG